MVGRHVSTMPIGQRPRTHILGTGRYPMLSPAEGSALLCSISQCHRAPGLSLSAVRITSNLPVSHLHHHLHNPRKMRGVSQRLTQPSHLLTIPSPTTQRQPRRPIQAKTKQSAPSPTRIPHASRRQPQSMPRSRGPTRSHSPAPPAYL